MCFCFAVYVFAAVVWIAQSSCKYHTHHNHDGHCHGLISLCINLHNPSVCLIKCVVWSLGELRGQSRLQDHFIWEVLADWLTHLDVVLTFGRHSLVHFLPSANLFFPLHPNEAKLFPNTNIVALFLSSFSFCKWRRSSTLTTPFLFLLTFFGNTLFW